MPHLIGIKQQLRHVLYAREVEGRVQCLVVLAVPSKRREGEGGRERKMKHIELCGNRGAWPV